MRNVGFRAGARSDCAAVTDKDCKRARRGRRRSLVGRGQADRRAAAVRQDLGAARHRRRAGRVVEGARVRVPGRAGGVRRDAAPAVCVRLGPRLRGMDGGLRHPRRRRARPASLLSGHGLARRGAGGEVGRSACAALRQGPDRGEAVRTPPRPVHRPFRRVHGHHEPLLLRRGRRDARPARLFQGLSTRPEADDPRPHRRRRRQADLHRDVAGQHRRRDDAAPGRRPLAPALFDRPGLLRRRPRHDLGRHHRRARRAQARIYPRRARALRRHRAQNRARQ